MCYCDKIEKCTQREALQRYLIAIFIMCLMASVSDNDSYFPKHVSALETLIYNVRNVIPGHHRESRILGGKYDRTIVSMRREASEYSGKLELEQTKEEA